MLFSIWIAALLVLASACNSEGLSSGSNEGGDAKISVRVLCSSTWYPDWCMQTLNISNPVRGATPRQLLTLAAHQTLRRADHAYRLAAKLAGSKGTPPLEIDALLDCHELMDDARDQISTSIAALNSLPNTTTASNSFAAATNSGIKKQLKMIKIQFSSSLSYQAACTDGFSNLLPLISSHSKSIMMMMKEQQMLYQDLTNCMTITDVLRRLCRKDSILRRRRLLSINNKLPRMKDEELEGLNIGLDEYYYPEWFSAGDRKLLQSPSVIYNSVVAQDGSGQYRKVQDAINKMPSSYPSRYIIYIKRGVYRENVEIAKKRKNLMLVGDGIGQTIITGNRNVASKKYTTFRSATIAISAPGFMARYITFQNVAGPEGHQAVAVRVGGDLSVFDTCSFEGYQDTLYALASRQFYRSCDIYGTVDYIFGNAIAVFQKCNLYARLPSRGQKNTYTAQGRTIPNDPSGFAFQNCNVLPATDLALSPPYSVDTYLGRPWKAYSRTVFLRSNMSSIVNPAGWLEWNASRPFTDTVFYGEYENTGAGSDTSQRVNWTGVHPNMSFADASQFSADVFISASTWLPQLGVAYDNL